MPGIDELLSFAQLMKHVETMAFDVIVFDTAPTGHTLRLLSIPATMEKAFDAIMGLKDKLGGMLGQMGSMFGNIAGGEAGLMSKIEETRATIQQVGECSLLVFCRLLVLSVCGLAVASVLCVQVYRMSQDPDCTTFVCVAIPEFLSLYVIGSTRCLWVQ